MNFVNRHIGPSSTEQNIMLQELNYESIDKLVNDILPENIREKGSLDLDTALSEAHALAKLEKLAKKNKVARSFIGTGYYETYTPSVILRNIIENPNWYTQYTPYQAEISQGRLEALFIFQTMICELTAMPIANACLLDEATAAAEAMAMSKANTKNSSNYYFVAQGCFPQTLDVLQTRAKALNIKIIEKNIDDFDWSLEPFGAFIQNPSITGEVLESEKLTSFAKKIHSCSKGKSLLTIAADILSLVKFKAPGQLGADIAIGSTQRFGVPMGYGGPHAAYFATLGKHKRQIPGRVIGLAKDKYSNPAYRMALQTREQHIRRDKATSNICTSQALLAIVSAMYSVYHGFEGLSKIAGHVNNLANFLRAELTKISEIECLDNSITIFDTVNIRHKNKATILKRAYDKNINFYDATDKEELSISINETTTLSDLKDILEIFTDKNSESIETLSNKYDRFCSVHFNNDNSEFIRTDVIFSQTVFKQYRSETKLMRFLHKLESRDLSLTSSMIPLGSCTMKLNAASELLPISWPEINAIHPFAPKNQVQGYLEIIGNLEDSLAEITGFDAVSVQPNSGAQGEFSGLLAIKSYHMHNDAIERNICLIPTSAHGTNPASAVMSGMKVVQVKCDDYGNIDVDDLKQKAELYKTNLAALMITYPSTHGVFESAIREICSIIHKNGGLVYLDGANMNAQVGLSKPGHYGADVCHLNLHKTFAIPHGGGGPGVGPIAVNKKLMAYLPSHHTLDNYSANRNIVSAAAYGSASVLPISLMYIWMLGREGLKSASQVAILNANYIAAKLSKQYSVLYTGNNNLVAHECIIDIRPIKAQTGIDAIDIAKRLIDYGFHAPTVSFPVSGTLMIEPTESEDLQEIDRFIDAMLSIHAEINMVKNNEIDSLNNPLKNAPHTSLSLCSATWDHPYSREVAVFPSSSSKDFKFWPHVARIDEAYGDRNFCPCFVAEN